MESMLMETSGLLDLSVCLDHTGNDVSRHGSSFKGPLAERVVKGATSVLARIDKVSGMSRLQPGHMRLWWSLRRIPMPASSATCQA